MAHSILQALECNSISRVFVSTDSEEYAQIARDYGAEVLYLRPAEISGDFSTDYEFFEYHVQWMTKNNMSLPDAYVQLRPTYPRRPTGLIDSVIREFNIDKYDSIRTVVPFEKSPYKMYRMNYGDDTTTLEPLFEEVDGIREPYNQCRQILPECFLHNGCIDIVKTRCLLEKKSVTGDAIQAFIMPADETDDIDTIDDFRRAERR